MMKKIKNFSLVDGCFAKARRKEKLYFFGARPELKLGAQTKSWTRRKQIWEE